MINDVRPNGPRYNLNEDSPEEEKTNAAEAVFSKLGDYLFDKVNLISHPFSLATTANAYGAPVAGVTDVVNYNGTSRLTDTSDGRFLDVGRKNRMKCSFYLTNYTKLRGYILSPVIYDSYSSLNSFNKMSDFRAYVGLKFEDSKVYVAVKEADKDEVTTEVDIELYGTGYTDTMSLEIINDRDSTELYLNSKFLGVFSTDMVGQYTTTKTFIPLLSPVQSRDGSSVNITIENFQFLQNR